MTPLAAPEIEQRIALFLDEQFPTLDEPKKRALALSFAASLQDQEPATPEDVARRYRAASAFLDRALVGVSDDTKRNVLRVMMNLGVRPDDEMNVLFAVYGYFSAMAEKVPQQMKAVIEELEQKETRFLDDVLLMRETGEKLIAKIKTDLETQAIEIGSTAVKSAVASEYEAMRYQISVIAKDAFAAYTESLKKERPRVAATPHPLAKAVFCCVLAIAALVGFIGYTLLAENGLKSTQAIRVREGATYERLWNDPTTPPYIRAWMEHWAKTH